MRVHLINESLDTPFKFLNYLCRQLDLMYFIKIQGNLTFWMLLLVIFGYYSHGYSSTITILTLVVIFSPLAGFFVYWTMFYLYYQKKDIDLREDFFINHQGSRIEYSNISVVEMGGDTNMSLTTNSLHDYKLVGYKRETYEKIVHIIVSSGVKPKIRYKQGFR